MMLRATGEGQGSGLAWPFPQGASAARAFRPQLSHLQHQQGTWGHRPLQRPQPRLQARAVGGCLPPMVIRDTEDPPCPLHEWTHEHTGVSSAQVQVLVV